MQEISWLGWSGLAVAAVGLTINLALMVGMLGGIHDIFSRISSGHGEVQQYRAIFETVRNIEGKSELVRAIKMTCCESPMNALIGFAELSLLVQMANLQRNPLFYVPYLLLQLTIQWDVRVLERLDRWQQKYRDHASNWLDALASLEALLSASAVRYENSGWAVPIWTEKGQATAHFESLSHPLLEDSQRVGNDVTIDISRPLLLVTGSNMAGKSTLLRSMGLNLLLARVGAPMCASSYLGPPLELSTSICVRDSLQDGVSFFMAELHRLRDVVDTAKRNTGPNGRPLLVLLDEILQGTNSRERQIAVMHVAQQLVELGALIAMSTHDLELADLPKIGEAGQVVHFREYFETVSGVECMRFDYKMRAGPTPTTNALKLLEFVGLRNAKNPI